MIWIDAQLPPSIAPWIEENFNEPCKAVRDIGLRDAADFDIFQKGKAANVIVMTKCRTSLCSQISTKSYLAYLWKYFKNGTQRTSYVKPSSSTSYFRSG